MAEKTEKTEDITNFSGLIDDYLRKESRGRRDDRFYPSELPSCIRLNYYRHRIPTEMPPEKLRMFKSADLAHSFIHDVLANSDRVKLLAWEKPFTFIIDDFEISGRLDDLIMVQIGDKKEPVVVEVKSVSGKAVDYIRGPRSSHLLQIHPYLRAAKSSIGILWYLARDTYADKHFTVFYDQKIMDEVIERARQLRRHLVDNTLPPPEAYGSPEAWQCRFCPHWQLCRDNNNPVKKEI